MENAINMTNLVEMTRDVSPELLELVLNLTSSLSALSSLSPDNSMQLLTAKDLRERLGLTHEGFNSLLVEVNLPRIKVGKSIRYPWIPVVSKLAEHAESFYEHSSFSDTLSIV